MLYELYFVVLLLAIVTLFYAFIYALQNFLAAEDPNHKKGFAIVVLLDIFAMVGLTCEVMGL